MQSNGAAIDGLREARTGVVLLFRRPFATIVVVTVLLGVAATNIGELIGAEPTGELGLLAMSADTFFLVTSIYLEIATILAAGGNGEGSAEGWIRAAVRHRCFWRFLAASFVMVFLILLGAVAFVVGAVVVASAVTLAQPAVVLERLGPVVAQRRSAELTRPVRKAVGIVFVLFWLPPLAANVMILLFEVDLALAAQIALQAAGTVLGIAATIALTRIFVTLGGAPTPPLQTLLYKPNAT